MNGSIWVVSSHRLVDPLWLWIGLEVLILLISALIGSDWFEAEADKCTGLCLNDKRHTSLWSLPSSSSLLWYRVTVKLSSSLLLKFYWLNIKRPPDFVWKVYIIKSDKIKELDVITGRALIQMMKFAADAWRVDCLLLVTLLILYYIIRVGSEHISEFLDFAPSYSQGSVIICRI